jgi:hypothetical protein
VTGEGAALDLALEHGGAWLRSSADRKIDAMPAYGFRAAVPEAGSHPFADGQVRRAGFEPGHRLPRTDGEHRVRLQLVDAENRVTTADLRLAGRPASPPQPEGLAPANAAGHM